MIALYIFGTLLWFLALLSAAIGSLGGIGYGIAEVYPLTLEEDLVIRIGSRVITVALLAVPVLTKFPFAVIP